MYLENKYWIMHGKVTIAVCLPMAKQEVANLIQWYLLHLIKQIGYGPNKGIVPIACGEIFDRIKKT